MRNFFSESEDKILIFLKIAITGHQEIFPIKIVVIYFKYLYGKGSFVSCEDFYTL